jgi:hypothetical protein
MAVWKWFQGQTGSSELETLYGMLNEMWQEDRKTNTPEQLDSQPLGIEDDPEFQKFLQDLDRAFSKNRGHIDRVLVIRTESGLPTIEGLEDAIMEFAIWFYGLLDSGELKLPVTLRLILSNGQCPFESFIEHRGQVSQDSPASDLPRLTKIEDWPAFVALEDSQGKKLTARMELD